MRRLSQRRAWKPVRTPKNVEGWIEMAKQYGHIKLSRKFFETDERWNAKRPRTEAEAWIDLIQMAAWKESDYRVPGFSVRLQRGQFVGSQRFLAKRWMWPKTNVFRFLRALEKEGKIVDHHPDHPTDHQADHRLDHPPSVYLLVNYDTYQSTGDEVGPPIRTAKRTTTRTATRTKVEAVKQLSSKTTTLPVADAPAPKAKRKSTAKYPAFPEEDCSALWTQWNQTMGAVEYSTFRKALGPKYQASQTVPDVSEISNAIVAYRESVDEMDERDAGFQGIHKFVQRLDNWIRLGAMPYSTPLGVLTERGRVLGSKAMREQQRGARVA